MNIPSEIYESLTPQQRIAATVAAIARGDNQERGNLVKTAPVKTYRATDLEYLDGMERLKATAAAVECDLRGCALDWLAAMRMDANSAADSIQGQAAALAAGWVALIAECGIDVADMTAAGAPQHPCVTALLAVADTPDPADVAANLDALRGFLKA